MNKNNPLFASLSVPKHMQLNMYLTYSSEQRRDSAWIHLLLCSTESLPPLHGSGNIIKNFIWECFWLHIGILDSFSSLIFSSGWCDFVRQFQKVHSSAEGSGRRSGCRNWLRQSQKIILYTIYTFIQHPTAAPFPLQCHALSLSKPLSLPWAKP